MSKGLSWMWAALFRLAFTLVMGWIFAGASMGGMFLPWLIGQLFEPIGPIVMMAAITINMVIALVVFGFITLTPKTGSVMVE